MNIVVLDGMGGGIGSRIVGILKEEIPPYIEVYGLGTNALATAAMLKKGHCGKCGKSRCDYRFHCHDNAQ